MCFHTGAEDYMEKKRNIKMPLLLMKSRHLRIFGYLVCMEALVFFGYFVLLGVNHGDSDISKAVDSNWSNIYPLEEVSTDEPSGFLRYRVLEEHKINADRLGIKKTKCFQLIWNESLFKKTLRILFQKQGGNGSELNMTAHAHQRQEEDNTPSYSGCKIITLADINVGRMGNNMFRVATLIATAYRHDFLPIIPKGNPLSKWFSLPNLSTIQPENVEVFRAKACCQYYADIESLNSSANWLLDGYFQSWRYFHLYRDVIKHAFRFNLHSLSPATSFLQATNISDLSVVCLHVRRGDMNHVLSHIHGYTIADMTYINKAMQYYDSIFNNLQFIVLSDDINWCKENIVDRNATFSPFENPGSDMALMSLCDHVIVTSGSYGWWGAWLANGVTVYYDGFPRKRSLVARETDLEDYYPKNWIGMS